jgi:hypothetical protein
MPHAFFCHSEHPFLVIPRGSEESSAWMLHCVQHDSVEHAARFFLSFRAPFPCHSEHPFLVIPSTFSLSFRAPFPCHSEHPFLVIPRGSEESSAWMLHCAGAPFSMTVHLQDTRVSSVQFVSFSKRASPSSNCQHNLTSAKK